MPDVRLLRPRTLIIHDNVKRKIFYIINIFQDEIINNYTKKYFEIKSELSKLLIQSSKNNILKLYKLDGIKFNLFTDKWQISEDKSVNYISIFKKI